MPITYNIDTDYLYQIGTEKGIEIGTEKGIENEKFEVIRNARHEGMSIEIIARIVNLAPEKVRQILDNLGIE